MLNRDYVANDKGAIFLSNESLLKEYEKACVDITDTNINMCVSWYLMASYAYYVEDDPILSDAQFDRLVRKTIENWDSIEHIHKEKLNMDMLKAGTFVGEYPSRIEYALQSLRSTYNGK